MRRQRLPLYVLAATIIGLLLAWMYFWNDTERLSATVPRQQPQNAQLPGPPLSLDAANPHYFRFRGETIPLITASPGYGSVTNLDVDYVALLNRLAAANLNKIRIFTGDFVIVDSGRPDSLHVRPNRFVKPWARSNVPGYAGSSTQMKFDLNIWDEKFFKRLDHFVSVASERSIVVEVCLFSQHYDDHIWSYSPLKSSNNINGVTEIPWSKFFTLSDPALVARQLAYVRKIVTALNGYDNLYYEVANEPLGTDWHNQIIDTILDAEASLPNKHLIAVNDPDVYFAAPNKPSIINTHYANDRCGGEKLHWIAAFELLDRYYSLNLPLGFDETSVTPQHQSADQARVEAWEFLVGGGSVYDNLNWTHPDKKLYRYLSVLQSFLSTLDLSKMRQDKTLIVSGLPPGAIWRAMSGGDGTHAIYIHHSAPGPCHYDPVKSTFQNTPTVALPGAEYSVTWIDPKTGKNLNQSRISSDGTVTLQSPRYTTDIAMKIVRIETNSAVPELTASPRK